METISELVDLGFTEYEAKVYLALLKENPSNGYQLSKRTGVPRSMVYEALGRLHARGAVLKTGSVKATLYQPVPPQNLLDRFDEEYHRKIVSLRKNLNSLTKLRMRIYFGRLKENLQSYLLHEK